MNDLNSEVNSNTDQNADHHSDENNACDRRTPQHKHHIDSRKHSTNMASSSSLSSSLQCRDFTKNNPNELEKIHDTSTEHILLRREKMGTLFKTRNSKSPISELHMVHDEEDKDGQSLRINNSSDTLMNSSINKNPSQKSIIHTDGWIDEDGILSSSSKGTNSFFRHEEVKYYRIVYRGIVSLLSEPDICSKKSGAYVSYGEIIASNHEVDLELLPADDPQISPPRRTGGALDRYLLKASSPVKSEFSAISAIPTTHSHSTVSVAKTAVSSLPLGPVCIYTNQKKALSPIQSESLCIQKHRLIEVKNVLTGGFALDAENTSVLYDKHIPRDLHGVTSNQSHSVKHSFSMDQTASLRISKMKSAERRQSKHHGYLMQYSRNGILIAEQIPAPPLLCQPGIFYYRVTSKTPLPILAGPCADAPLTRGLALPGTVHEISLRMGSLDHHELNVVRNLEDGVVFLRLSHRRGWIADRRFIHNTNEDDEESFKSYHPHQRSNTTIEFVMKEIPDYVDVTSFDVGDDMSLGGTSISSASFATPSTIILSRRRSIRHKNVKDSRSGMIVQHKLKRNESGYVSLQRSDEDVSDDGMTNNHSENERPSNQLVTASMQKPSVFLMRVTAPNGLKILDAPHFQVNNLIKGQSALAKIGIREVSNSRGSFNEISKSGWEIDVSGKFRILPRGTLFEASRRLEKSTNYSSGSGLIKLADNTGWAIVPTSTELLEQYRSSAGISVSENDQSLAYEEVGNAIDNGTVDSYNEDIITWIRVIQPQGIAVSCPPLKSSEKNRTLFSSSLMQSSGLTIDTQTNASDASKILSANSASLLDSFRSTRKSDSKVDGFIPGKKTSRKLQSSLVIPCGTCIKVDKWVASSSQALNQRFLRICGEQGWVPRTIHGMQYCVDIKPPDVRTGSFWFRVQPKDGIKVRIGPSSRSPEIKSNNKHFIFECGEYLRASEVLTIHGHADVVSPGCLNSENPSESFARLYRKQTSDSTFISDGKEKDYTTLESLTAPGEWVQIHCNVDLYLQECANPPIIERNSEGWRYEATSVTGVEIRKGPSLASSVTESRLQHCAIVLVNERVMSEGSTITWLRLKDGRGWVQDTHERGDCLMKEHSGKTKNAKDGSSVNKIISRLGLNR